MRLFMLVTSDQYELPMIVADSAAELARKCGVNVRSIYRGIEHRNKGIYRSHFVSVEIEEDDS